MRKAFWWTVLAGITLASAAFAQSEQWLQYHRGGGNRGYRWLEDCLRSPGAGIAAW
ncbi:MAG: hypothetical protein M1608_10685 [Candidatus Omnitrophica bacterium]|nr:hypothetical protein [Candidatus Omnitrophota bacterium]